MKQKIQSLLSDLCTVAHLRLESNDEEFTKTVLAAYNRFQEDERDGVDYLFDINNKDDVKCCLDGGLSVPDLAKAYFDYEARLFTPHFFFGVNHPKPSFIMGKEGLKKLLQNYLSDIIRYAFCYHNVAEYSVLLDRLISDYMIEQEMV